VGRRDREIATESVAQIGRTVRPGHGGAQPGDFSRPLPVRAIGVDRDGIDFSQQPPANIRARNPVAMTLVDPPTSIR
jgi:hypothetical protein